MAQRQNGNNYNRQYSQRRSMRTSEQMRSAMYGSHHGSHAAGPNGRVVPRAERMSRHSGNASSAGFSNQRRARRAHRGYVDQLTPTTSTRETSSAYSRRMGNRGFGQEIQHKSRMKRILFLVISVLLVVLVGATAARFAFHWSVDGRLASTDTTLSSALVSEQSGQPYYALLCADLNDTDGAKSIDAMMLARIDEAQKKITLLMLPGNLRVNHNESTVSASRLMASVGEGSVVKAVSSLVGVDISHYLFVDRTAFTSVVDKLGGVEIDVTQTVDDPYAGSDYLARGVQTLNGSSAATYVMASNYTEGVQTQLACQQVFAKAMAALFFAESGFSLNTELDGLADHISTDWNSKQLNALLESLKNIQADDISTAQVDGSVYTPDDNRKNATFVAATTSLTQLISAIEQGQDGSQLQTGGTVDVDKESFEITVRNGSGVTGGAKMLSDILTNAGFIVSETGNAESYVYTETLIIYLDSAYQDDCEAVRQALGLGRVVNGINGYTFDTEVLVVLGSDWKPLN